MLRNTDQEKITPPGSFTKAPLTPPPTDQKLSKPVSIVLKLLRSFKKGLKFSKSPWLEFKLRHEEYDELLQHLRSEKALWSFVLRKVRYDYYCITNLAPGTFVLRMPTLLHEIFMSRVVEEIQSELRAIQTRNSQSRRFIDKIKHNGSGRLLLRGSDDEGGQSIIRREPDATFTHQDAHWPGVVIEVSYSQKTKSMPYLADDYILETNGSIRVVVGLDIDYSTKQGMISVWRPQYATDEQGQLELEATQIVKDQVFRDLSGNVNPAEDAGLKLNLKDFAPDDLCHDIDGSFLISSATLCHFLAEAEIKQEEAIQGQGVVQQLVPGAKKRRRERTPPEEMHSEDDQRFEAQVRRVRARVSDGDSSYKASEPEEQEVAT